MFALMGNSVIAPDLNSNELGFDDPGWRVHVPHLFNFTARYCEPLD